MTMNRREFLFTLGCSTATIAGWVVLPSLTLANSNDLQANDHFPRLARDVHVRKTRNGADLMRVDEQGELKVVCRVNRLGSRIVGNLHGKKSLQGLARKIHQGFDPSEIEHTEASVAAFLALLAQAGLLSQPFFVNLYAGEVTA